MSKKGFISLLIIAVLTVLIGILFGTVFCLRTQNVTVVGESNVNVSKDEIITAAGFKQGKSIFMLDKENAINNIEKTYSHIKVIQIKTTGLTKIDIIIRARHEMFYAELNDTYYELDEELKVLNVFEKSAEEQPSNEPTNLIYLDAEALNINNLTKKCDFVGSKKQQESMYELCKGITNNIKSEHDGEKEYYTREDMCDIIKNVEFQEFNTFDKIVLTTKYGVKLDIENPAKNMAHKINICFTTIKLFVEQGENKEKSGTIKIYYDLDGIQQNVYIPYNAPAQSD